MQSLICKETIYLRGVLSSVVSMFDSLRSGLFDKLRKKLHVFSDTPPGAISAVVFYKSVVLGKAELATSGGHIVPRLALCADKGSIHMLEKKYKRIGILQNRTSGHMSVQTAIRLT
ncbi:hypothetical protein KUTeg_006464 [Tegillarca granosa]|uniref:Uncharacterized protein n=1 Tax=Tegillarca granosa TaxID=220873 RepID=A0ABQ9FJI7_TEGGR|nr:hypothetical protein KUTeg_006464 [Tegillarca granosa]